MVPNILDEHWIFSHILHRDRILYTIFCFLPLGFRGLIEVNYLGSFGLKWLGRIIMYLWTHKSLVFPPMWLCFCFCQGKYTKWIWSCWSLTQVCDEVCDEVCGIEDATVWKKKVFFCQWLTTQIKIYYCETFYWIVLIPWNVCRTFSQLTKFKFEEDGLYEKKGRRSQNETVFLNQISIFNWYDYGQNYEKIV